MGNFGSPIEIRVGGLELGFEADAEPGEIHEPPAGEGPEAVFSVVLDAGQQMHRVVGDFQGFVFRLEVKRAEGAGGGALLDELGIQIEDGFGRQIDDAQIGVAGALMIAGAVRRDFAGESRSGAR